MRVQLAPDHGEPVEATARGSMTRERRLRIIAAHGFQCAKCEETEGLEVDHVTPLWKGGSATDDNLDLETLDHAEIVEGYLDGFNEEPEAGDNRSHSYWHGYENGKADKEHRARPESVELAREIFGRRRKP